MQFLLILFVSGMVLCADTANILGLFPLPGKSHYVMFERLLKGLAERGHHVDVATQFPSKEAPPRYNQLSLEGSLPILDNNFSMTILDRVSDADLVYFMTTLLGVDVCEATLKTQVLQDLKSTKKKYDLVITEIFGSDCMLGFGYHFQTPTVSIMSSVALPWANDRIGNPDNPSYIPNYFVSLSPKMSFYERLENTLKLIASKFWYNYFSSKKSNQVAKEFFGLDIPSLETLTLNTSLILTNSHFSISYPRPTVPGFIEVGGLHILEPKPLSKYFEDLLKTDKKGVIYLSMGSLIAMETFDYDKLQAIFDAFAELPYKVLWKATFERFPQGLRVPKNVHFEEWMPQMDILCHPNIKLFVSHGGLMGAHEAVYCGVPRLGIPLFADQKSNIRAAENMGMVIKVDYKNIRKETILEASIKLLEDPFYKQNCERISKQFKDRPMSPLDTAVYWVEYVIRHKGAPHLRTAGADLPWYQYFLVDVIIVLLTVLLAILLTFIFVIKFIFNFVYRKKIKND